MNSPPQIGLVSAWPKANFSAFLTIDYSRHSNPCSPSNMQQLLWTLSPPTSTKIGFDFNSVSSSAYKHPIAICFINQFLFLPVKFKTQQYLASPSFTESCGEHILFPSWRRADTTQVPHQFWRVRVT